MLSDFSYITVPGFTGDIKEDVKALLCANGRQKTFDHVKAVADANEKIAAQYGLDIKVCALCGYLHDISAVITSDDMLSYAEKNSLPVEEAERKYPFLLHQRISRQIACRDFGITDTRILSSVECHSTLKANPSPYDMALFIADKLAWDQNDPPPFYNIVKTALSLSLEAASLAYMDFIVEHKMILYPHPWFVSGRSFLSAPTGGSSGQKE